MSYILCKITTSLLQGSNLVNEFEKTLWDNMLNRYFFSLLE